MSVSCWAQSEPQLPQLENGLVTSLPHRLSMGPGAMLLHLGLPTEDSRVRLCREEPFPGSMGSGNP